MQSFFTIGFDFIFFWFFQAPKGLITYFASFNNAFLKFFSFRLFLSTFFKPWKNEYRQGLVGFSIVMGVFLKSIMIIFDLLLLLIFVVIEFAFVVAFLVWPFATAALLFIK